MGSKDEARGRDLELARACAAGDVAAQTALKQRFEKELVAIAQHMGADANVAAEIVQQAWIRILVPVPPNGARIGTYSGKGNLGAWLRMVVVRLVMGASRARTEPVETLDDALVNFVASPCADPEVEYLKRVYAAEFRAAFRAAGATLTVRQRNLLREYFVLQLSIDQLAAMYGVHRTTAFRQVESAREALIAATRAELATRLRVSPESVESIMRLIKSRIDLDLASL